MYSDYVVRAAKERRDNPPFVANMTWKEWMALSDAEQEALWDKWHQEAWEDIDEIGEIPHARITSTTRQKRRAKNGTSSREN